MGAASTGEAVMSYGGTAYGRPAYGVPGTRAQMRATDADRERVAGLLNSAYTEGRLTKDEHGARLDRALTAATYADLDSCVADLVPPPSPVPGYVKTNTLAIISLVCGIGQVVLWPLTAIAAIILGHVARNQIRQTGEGGSGLALAGLILGWIGVAVLVLGILALVLLLVAFARAPGTVPAGFR